MKLSEQLNKGNMPATTNAPEYGAFSIVGGEFIYAPGDVEEIRVKLSKDETRFKLTDYAQKAYYLERADFFKLVRAERGRKSACVDGGTEYVKAINYIAENESNLYVIMPPDDRSTEICAVLRNGAGRERTALSRRKRCVVNGVVCRHNCQKCGRNQESGFVRETCPLSAQCEHDCASCPCPRNIEGDLSYETSQEMGFELPDANAPSAEDVFKMFADKELRKAVKDNLSPSEYAIIVYTVYQDKTVADFARETYDEGKHGKFKTYEQQLSRLKKKALKKLAPLLEEYAVD